MKTGIFVRHAAILLVLWGCLAIPAAADVMLVKNGMVVLGTLKSAATGSLTYFSLGQDVTIAPTDVVRTETDLANAKDLLLEVHLKDGSILKGSISDFDPDIGLFVDMGFGVVNIPIDAIQEIRQEAQRKMYLGPQAFLQGAFLIAQPLTSQSGLYGMGFGGSIMFLSAIPGARGLYAGASADFVATDYLLVPEVDNYLIQINGTVQYKLLELKTAPGIASWFSPFVGIGVGAAVVLVNDTRPAAPAAASGAINPAGLVQIGVDIAPAAPLNISITGDWRMVFEPTGLFNQLGASLYIGVTP